MLAVITKPQEKDGFSCWFRNLGQRGSVGLVTDLKLSVSSGDPHLVLYAAEEGSSRAKFPGRSSWCVHQRPPVCSPMQTGQGPKWFWHARQDLAVVGKAQSLLSMHRLLCLLVLVMWRFPPRNGCGIWLLF